MQPLRNFPWRNSSGVLPSALGDQLVRGQALPIRQAHRRAYLRRRQRRDRPSADRSNLMHASRDFLIVFFRRRQQRCRGHAIALPPRAQLLLHVFDAEFIIVCQIIPRFTASCFTMPEINHAPSPASDRAGRGWRSSSFAGKRAVLHEIAANGFIRSHDRGRIRRGSEQQMPPFDAQIIAGAARALLIFRTHAQHGQAVHFGRSQATSCSGLSTTHSPVTSR